MYASAENGEKVSPFFHKNTFAVEVLDHMALVDKNIVLPGVYEY